MKTILVNPPSPYLLDDAAYPPSGLMYLAAALEALGTTVEIADLAGDRDWKKRAASLEADLYGVTCVTPNFNTVREICALLPRQKPILVGGPHATFLPRETLEKTGCSAVVTGEAEVIIGRVVDDLRNGRLEKIYRGGSVPVEAIPPPARHLVDLRRYHPGGVSAVPVYSSRGCPFNCSFCAKITGRVYRALPIDRVIAEVAALREQGFEYIVFGDDNIGIDEKRLRELLLRLKPLGVKFRLNQDVRGIREDLLALAREAGCIEISYGVESGSPGMLKRMNKQASREDNERAITLTRKHGLSARAYFVVNFPGETEATVAETIDFAAKTRPDKWLVSAFAPLPGSPAFNRPGDFGITWLSGNWEDYHLAGRDFTPCFESEGLDAATQRLLYRKLKDGLDEIAGRNK